jgi:hypothetical protein
MMVLYLLITPHVYMRIKNDEIASCGDALIHESPISFLKSPIYTIEEKYAYVEKYLCGLQIAYEFF